MLNKHETTRLKIGGNNDIIDYWLNFRQQLIMDYSTVAGLTGENKNSLPTEAELNRFCETLIDYISAGHFRIYNMIMERWESTSFSSNAEIDALYLKIMETTTPLLTFNDKYTEFVLSETDYAQFDENISRVGEILALRFEKEDMYIQLIVKSLSSPTNA